MPHTKGQVLSRRVWDILSLLPTSPTLLNGFQKLDTPLNELLNPSSAQKLMYSLYIIESLSVKNPHMKGKESEENHNPWCQKFIQHGGLRHLFDIFKSGEFSHNKNYFKISKKFCKLIKIEICFLSNNFSNHRFGKKYIFLITGVLQRDGGDGCEWQQDCLASLLKTLYQLGVEQWSSELKQSRTDKIVIPNLNEVGRLLLIFFVLTYSFQFFLQTMISMMDVKTTLPQLTSILEEASLPKDLNQYKTGLWGRAQVVHYALGLLVSWLHSSEEAQEALFTSQNFSTWLKRLVSTEMLLKNCLIFFCSFRFWRTLSQQSDEKLVQRSISCVWVFQQHQTIQSST